MQNISWGKWSWSDCSFKVIYFKAFNVMRLEVAYYAAREFSILSPCPWRVQPSALRSFFA